MPGKRDLRRHPQALIFIGPWQNKLSIWPIYTKVHSKSKSSHSFYSTVAMKLHTFVWLRVKTGLEKQENQRPSQLSATKRRTLDARPFQKNCCDLILYHFSPQTKVFYWIWDNWRGVLWETLSLQLFREPSKRPGLSKGWGLPGRPRPQLVCVVPVARGCSVNKVNFLPFLS